MFFKFSKTNFRWGEGETISGPKKGTDVTYKDIISWRDWQMFDITFLLAWDNSMVTEDWGAEDWSGDVSLIYL